jgi:hypothetical protein
MVEVETLKSRLTRGEEATVMVTSSRQAGDL